MTRRQAIPIILGICIVTFMLKTVHYQGPEVTRISRHPRPEGIYWRVGSCELHIDRKPSFWRRSEIWTECDP